jgi:hypothetical protein
LIRDGYAVNGMYAAHEYAFTNVYWYAGRWYVRIYNPYGVDRVHDAGLHPGRDGVNDGFTTITWENFMATFYKYNWA